MNRKLVSAACMALVLAACGDRSDTATGSAEPGMMENAMDTASETASGEGDATGETMQEPAMAGDAEAVDTASETMETMGE
jgi:hypothetical protein